MTINIHDICVEISKEKILENGAENGVEDYHFILKNGIVFRRVNCGLRMPPHMKTHQKFKMMMMMTIGHPKKRRSSSIFTEKGNSYTI